MGEDFFYIREEIYNKETQEETEEKEKYRMHLNQKRQQQR